MTYTTILGDTWDGIAAKLYGSETRMTLLLKANPRWAKTVVFSAGVVLIVPEAEEETFDDLPPWKRG